MGAKKIAVNSEIKRKKQIHDLLMNENNTISIEEALEDAKKRWPRSK